MRNNFYGHDDTETYIVQDRTMAVEVPIELALEVHAFLVNNERRNDKCMPEADPRYYQPIHAQVSTITEKFGERISQCYRFERHNNSTLMKKLEEESKAHEGTKQLLKALKEAPRAARD